MNALHAKTQTVYSAYSLFFKERKLQKKNSRDLAKFQNLLERRRLVGHEKSVEITGSLFSKFMVCLPCNVAGEFPISTCEILSSALSPSCTKSLVTNASRRSVSSASPCPHWFPAGAAPLKLRRQSIAGSADPGTPAGGRQWQCEGSVLASVCSYRVLSISRCNRNNDQGIEAFLS